MLASFTFYHQAVSQDLISPLTASSIPSPPNPSLIWSTLIPTYTPQLDSQSPLLPPDLKASRCTASAQHTALHFCSFWSPKDLTLVFSVIRSFAFLFLYYLLFVEEGIWQVHVPFYHNASAFRGLKSNVGKIQTEIPKYILHIKKPFFYVFIEMWSFCYLKNI